MGLSLRVVPRASACPRRPAQLTARRVCSRVTALLSGEPPCTPGPPARTTLWTSRSARRHGPVAPPCSTSQTTFIIGGADRGAGGTLPSRRSRDAQAPGRECVSFQGVRACPTARHAVVQDEVNRDA